MLAIQKPNVDVHFTEVTGITSNAVIGNGVEVEVDTIICATGFDTSFRPAFPIIGRRGVNLAEKWAKHPEAYLGLAVPDMPNFFTFVSDPEIHVHADSSDRSFLADWQWICHGSAGVCWEVCREIHQEDSGMLTLRGESSDSSERENCIL